MLVHTFTIEASDGQEISERCVCMAREEVPELAKGVQEVEGRVGKRFATRTEIMEDDLISL